MEKKTGVHLDPHAPRTNFILGAALSGGDPLKAAQMFTEMTYPPGEGADPIECEMNDCPGCHECSSPNDPKVDKGPRLRACKWGRCNGTVIDDGPCDRCGSRYI